MCLFQEVKDTILKRVVQHGRNRGLKGFELVRLQVNKWVLSNSLHMDVKCRQQAIFCYFSKPFFVFQIFIALDSVGKMH